MCLCCRQTAARNDILHAGAVNFGESVTYDVYFKWGLIMSRAGDATFSCDSDYSVDNSSSCYRMLFKTAKFFDNFFMMRDTLNTYYNDNRKLVYSMKSSDEGGYYSVDKLTFTHSKENIKIHSLRYTPSKVKVDTVITAQGNITDLLGVVYYLRSLDRTRLKSGDTYPLTVVMGRDLVKIQFIYRNQAIIERDKVKYNTRYFVIDIYDEAFESSKTSAEVWIGDDDNFLPVKVRSKLKIGYVEVYYKESSNLAHPMKCCAAIKK
jgi:hypothetical protein